MISFDPLPVPGTVPAHPGARRRPVKAVRRPPGPGPGRDLRERVDPDPARDHGNGFAGATLRLLPELLADAGAGGPDRGRAG